MSFSSPTSLLDVDVQPGKPPMLHVDLTWGSAPHPGSVAPHDRGRLPRAGRSHDGERGLRAAADLLPWRLLRVEVAAQPAYVHAPRMQLRAGISRPDAVRVPRCAD